MDQTACCTCATLLSQTPRFASSSSSSEKQRPLPDDRLLECCGRVICGNCIHKNARFSTYCPYCQTSSSSSPTPFIPRGKTAKLRVKEDQLEEEANEPPSYEDISMSSTKPSPSVGPGNEEPPPYTAETNFNTQLPPSYNLLNTTTPPINPDQKKKPSDPDSPDQDDEENEPILHFLNHPNDTIQSLSLRYSIPPQTLRSFNRLSSDHLLLARQTILIPRHFSSSSSQTSKSKQKVVSLSPTPIHGEEEQIRKNKLRRWMVTCKVHDYDVALLYLEQAGYDLDAATEAYFADEAWEREHPIPFLTGAASSSSSRGQGSGIGSSSSSSRETGGGKWDKVRAYHQQRLNGRVPSNLLN